MDIEIINVSNGTKNYPGNFTKKEIAIIKQNSIGNILNLFSGKSNIGNTRVDFSCKEATHNMDVFSFLLKNKTYFDTIIIDFPYNKTFGNKYQKIGNTPKQFIGFASVQKTNLLFQYIIEMKPKIVIMKSWNFYILKNYKLKKGFLCYPGGYRKSTILLILYKSIM
jgi:hypothetical protein